LQRFLFLFLPVVGSDPPEDFYYGRKAHFGQTSPSLSTTTGMCGLPKMGAKKAVNLFRLTACMPL